MAVVRTQFRNTKIELECDNPERLKTLAARFEKRMNDLCAAFNNASDLKLALMAGIILEDQIEGLLKKVENDQSEQSDELLSLKKSYHDSFNQVADYLEKLAQVVEES